MWQLFRIQNGGWCLVLVKTRGVSFLSISFIEEIRIRHDPRSSIFHRYFRFFPAGAFVYQLVTAHRVVTEK